MSARTVTLRYEQHDASETGFQQPGAQKDVVVALRDGEFIASVEMTRRIEGPMGCDYTHVARVWIARPA